MNNAARRVAVLGSLILAVSLTACGGGGGGSAPPPDKPATPLPADLAVTAPAQPEEALAQQWGNSAATVAGLTFSWNFGDGGSSTEARPSHAFSAPGAYTVKLTVSNESGQSREVTSAVNIARFKPSSGANCGRPGETGWCLLGGERRLAPQFDAQGRGWSGNELGEIYTSADGGKTWNRVLQQRGGAVLAFHADAKAVRALTDQGWVWKSTDNGATWTHTESGQTFSAQARVQVPPSLQVVGDTTVIIDKAWITQDDGATWRAFPPSAALLDVSPDGTLWFRTQTEVAGPGGVMSGEFWVSELQRSRDGGRTLTTVLTTPTLGYGLLALAVRSNTRLLAMAPLNAPGNTREYWQWSSEDGGDHWTAEAAPGIPVSPLGLIDLDLYAGSSGADWAILPMGVFRRSSAVEPWVFVHAALDGPCMGQRSGDAGFALACKDSFALTTDGGRTWHGETRYDALRTPNGGPVALELQGGGSWWVSRRLAKLASGAVALSVNGMLALSDDDGDHWRSVLGPMNLRQVWMTDRRNGWAFDGSGGLLATADGGRHWTAKPAPMVDGAWLSLWFTDAQHGWLNAFTGQVARTEDGGETWQTVTTGDAGYFDRYQFFDSKRGVGFRGGAFRITDDGGKTWTSTSIPVGSRALAFRNVNVGLVAVGDGNVVRTVDGGRTWQTITVAPTWIKDLVFVDDNVVLAIAAADIVARSTDAGQTWSFVKVAGLEDSSRLRAAGDGHTLWLVGSAGQIFRSSDAGLNWQLQGTGVLAPAVAQTRFRDAFFRDAQTGWLVDDIGRLWVTDSGGE